MTIEAASTKAPSTRGLADLGRSASAMLRRPFPWMILLMALLFAFLPWWTDDV